MQLNFEREAKLIHSLRTEQNKVATARVFLRSLFLVATDHNSLSEDKILSAFRFAINVSAEGGPSFRTAEMSWGYNADDWEISFAGHSREIEFRAVHSAETQIYECVWVKNLDLEDGDKDIFIDLRDGQLVPNNSVDEGNLLTDLEFLSTHQNAENLRRRPLWAKLPEHIDLEVSSLLSFFTSDPRKWEFWNEWYQGYLTGDPVEEVLEYHVSQIPEAIWDEGAEAIAREIEQIRKRLAVERALSDLKSGLIVQATARYGIGGNNPPERIEDERLSGAITLIWEAEQELSSALEEEKPARERIEAVLKKLMAGCLVLTKWLGRKADLAVDTAIATAIKQGGLLVGGYYALDKLIKAIEDWLPYLP
ncbi:hypothetical protein [Ruegeria sp. ANG-S4]|uniref:hypothetical protein n=1 Tax=Ruegeria sp. ANG-S4 TaxID=1577904 RepID=UPI00126A0C09|nr:hypothetical protein [Ruegeria sp. ANG-S4]